MASEAPEGWESVAALQEAYAWTLAGLERANAEVVALGSALVKAVRERDSLARRCATRFEETEVLRATVRYAEADRNVAFAQRDAMLPVVEAAKAWRVLHSPDPCREARTLRPTGRGCAVHQGRCLMTPYHPEDKCRRCGGPNLPWSAPSPLWNQVMRGGSINGDELYDGIVCPTCFAVLAEERNIADLWRLSARRVSVELETVTPSGRVWDEQTWMWRDPNEVAHRRPTITVLCGSTRFYDAFREANLRLTVGGHIVLSIGCDTRTDGDLFGDLDETALDKLKANLDELHKRKIDLADEVLVLNVGGYIGESTRAEIEYAEKLGRPIRYLVEARSEVPDA